MAAFLFTGALGLCVPARAAVPAAERQALVNLYNSTNGANWLSDNNWLTGDPCEDAWEGIVCNGADQHVRFIDLSENQLSGSLPDLSALANLETVWLSDNQLSGSIPSLSALLNLENLDLSGNQLTGPIPSLSTLGSLQRLYLANNQLSGSIPSLSALANLKGLRVEYNQLSGTPPAVPSP
ncbi:MAG: leucine-rich repeat domain-containing protein, partial [Rhodanobacteraceae bacterium]|nr:leucine-rich repeat domain-containing protein [Rhodanobacteraceae bacterium]